MPSFLYSTCAIVFIMLWILFLFWVDFFSNVIHEPHALHLQHISCEKTCSRQTLRNWCCCANMWVHDNITFKSRIFERRLPLWGNRTFYSCMNSNWIHTNINWLFIVLIINLKKLLQCWNIGQWAMCIPMQTIICKILSTFIGKTCRNVV